MTELTPELAALGRDLTAGFNRLLARRRRTRRRVRVVAATVALFGAFTAIAVASGIGDDLQLDPTKWTVFESGSVDGGKAKYVRAHAKDGSGDSTFILEHDAGLERYEAFVLHERAVAAARGAVPGALCTAEQLTHAEQVAMSALRAAFAPGTAPEVTTATVDRALETEFAGELCRGLDYAGERARWVYAGVEPKSMLMPAVR